MVVVPTGGACGGRAAPLLQATGVPAPAPPALAEAADRRNGSRPAASPTTRAPASPTVFPAGPADAPLQAAAHEEFAALARPRREGRGPAARPFCALVRRSAAACPAVDLPPPAPGRRRAQAGSAAAAGPDRSRACREYRVHRAPVLWFRSRRAWSPGSAAPPRCCSRSAAAARSRGLERSRSRLWRRSRRTAPFWGRGRSCRGRASTGLSRSGCIRQARPPPPTRTRAPAVSPVRRCCGGRCALSSARPQPLGHNTARSRNKRAAASQSKHRCIRSQPVRHYI